MNEGKIIEYIDQGRFVCTLCLQDKGNRLHLLTPSNREVNLSPKRAVLISQSAIDPIKPREELLERLRQTEEARNRLKEQFDVEELWELIRDEQESFNHTYLAQLVFGDSISDDHLSAVMRGLFEDRLYFKLKDGRFLPNSEAKVSQMIRQKQEEALREEKFNQGSAWLKEVKAGQEPAEMPFKEEIVTLLKELALYGADAPNLKYGKELLSRAGITDIGEARALLVRLGAWEEDENLDLLRFDIDTSFSERDLELSDRLAQKTIDLAGREDLTYTHIITIDGPYTCDFDDAMSLEIVGDEIHLGVHIADVAAVVSPDTDLDRLAAERASSLYLPRRQVPMIPPALSQNTLSLKQGCDRPTLSLLAHFSKQGELLHYRFVPSIIRVKEQLTYEEVNESLERVPLFQEIHRLSQRLRQARMDQGGLSLALPELQVTVNPDGSVSLDTVSQTTPSRMMVAELMILYNWLAARFCSENRIPVLYRTQSPPSEVLTSGDKGYLFYVLQQRRKLSPLQIQSTPVPHSGLGVDMYIQCTSPIRRYLDLVTQRQIRNWLTKQGPLVDEAGLEEIRLTAEPTVRNLEIIKRNRLRYWTLKFLSQQVGERFKAIVLDELKTKYRIVLTDFYLISEIKKQNGMLLTPGQEIGVEIKKADPHDDLLRLSPV